MAKKALAPSTPITTRDPKGRKFISIVTDAYDKAELSEEEAQSVNNAKGLADLISNFIATIRCLALLTKSEQMAADILGRDKVAGYRDAVRVWDGVINENEPTMPFSKEAFEECAEENKRGAADWRLVWINGFSLRRQEEIRGRNRKQQPCFDPDYTWWLETEQDFWATQSISVGYQLLDLKKNFSNLICQKEDEEIAKLGKGFERAEEQAVSEACFTFYLISGKKERLLKNWCHRGRLQDSDGDRVSVGDFDSDGFDVDYVWDDDADPSLGVVRSRKSR